MSLKHTVVTTLGMQWKRVSPSERGTTHEGRHYYARRSKASGTWRLQQNDQDIVETGRAKGLRVWKNRFANPMELTTAVRHADELPSQTYDEYRAAKEALE